jgi:DNA-directed RNA polymerase specialized sigma24 family protein
MVAVRSVVNPHPSEKGAIVMAQVEPAVYNERLVRYWTRRYLVDAEDAQQEVELARRMGLSPRQLQRRLEYIGSHRMRHELSLDVVYGEDNAENTQLNYLVVRDDKDTTYEKVLKALAYWMQKKTLTAAQAEAILMMDVDQVSLTHVAEIYHMSHATVKYHHDRGILRLREACGVQVEQRKQLVV